MSLLHDQWQKIKDQYPDALVWFQCGEFVEVIDKDAEETSQILGTTLTKNEKEGYSMTGFPAMSLDTNLHKAVKAGKKVAFVEQLAAKRCSKCKKEVVHGCFLANCPIALEIKRN